MEEFFGCRNRLRRRNGGYVNLHHWKSSACPDLAFPPLQIKNLGLLLGVNAAYTHSHRPKKKNPNISREFGQREKDI